MSFLNLGLRLLGITNITSPPLFFCDDFRSNGKVWKFSFCICHSFSSSQCFSHSSVKPYIVFIPKVRLKDSVCVCFYIMLWQFEGKCFSFFAFSLKQSIKYLKFLTGPEYFSLSPYIKSCCFVEYMMITLKIIYVFCLNWRPDPTHKPNVAIQYWSAGRWIKKKQSKATQRRTVNRHQEKWGLTEALVRHKN